MPKRKTNASDRTHRPHDSLEKMRPVREFVPPFVFNAESFTFTRGFSIWDGEGKKVCNMHFQTHAQFLVDALNSYQPEKHC